MFLNFGHMHDLHDWCFQLCRPIQPIYNPVTLTLSIVVHQQQQKHQSEFTKLRAAIRRPRKPCKDQLLKALLWSIVIVLWCRVAGLAGFNFVCNYNCCLTYWVAHVLDPAQWKTAIDCFINYRQFKDKLQMSYFSLPSIQFGVSGYFCFQAGRSKKSTTWSITASHSFDGLPKCRSALQSSTKTGQPWIADGAPEVDIIWPSRNWPPESPA
jgi:hypothetical protein